MTELRMQKMQRGILVLLSVLLICSPVFVLAACADQSTGLPPELSESHFGAGSSSLLIQADTSPAADPNGNAYAYGHDKDRATQTPGQTPSPTVSATPSPVPTTTPSPTQTVTPASTRAAAVTTVPTIAVTTAPVGTLAPAVIATPATGTQLPAKQVPLSGVIPEEALPAAAAGSAIAITGIIALFNSTISSWGGQITSFLKNAFGGVITGKILDRDKERRTIISEETEKLYFGFSKKELLVLLAGTLIIGILFLYADRQPFEPAMIAIYIVMGGLSLVIHELAHLYFEHKFTCRTEIQFWGIGTVIMAVTAWLFGNVFAQPFLTLVHSQKPLEKRSLGYMMLSGPAVSTLLAFLCLLLIPMGGLFRTAGMIGFLMNMVTAVFELLPIPPCEGKEIFAWNKLVWAGAFVPLFAVYLFMTM
ncbi:MAG: hypothetical protein WC586_07205 [Methanoregula sp.]